MNTLYETLFGSSPGKKPQPEQSKMKQPGKNVAPISDNAPQAGASSSSRQSAIEEQAQQYDKQGNPIFAKQQMAWYKRNNETPKQLVTIVGVHFDDYPNIYYTIRPLDPSKSTYDEKQTDANRLSLVDKNEKIAMPEKKEKKNEDTITIHFSFNKKDASLQIDPKLSIANLKEELSKLTGCALKEMKLTYKGIVLKEEKTSISQSQLVNGSKIQLTKAKAR